MGSLQSPSQRSQPLLLSALVSSQGPLVGAAAQVLLAIMANCTQGGGEHILDRAGLLPHRLRKSRELMEALTASSSGAHLQPCCRVCMHAQQQPGKPGITAVVAALVSMQQCQVHIACSGMRGCMQFSRHARAQQFWNAEARCMQVVMTATTPTWHLHAAACQRQMSDLQLHRPQQLHSLNL